MLEKKVLFVSCFTRSITALFCISWAIIFFFLILFFTLTCSSRRKIHTPIISEFKFTIFFLIHFNIFGTILTSLILLFEKLLRMDENTCKLNHLSIITDICLSFEFWFFLKNTSCFNNMLEFFKANWVWNLYFLKHPLFLFFCIVLYHPLQVPYDTFKSFIASLLLFDEFIVLVSDFDIFIQIVLSVFFFLQIEFLPFIYYLFLEIFNQLFFF